MAFPSVPFPSPPSASGDRRRTILAALLALAGTLAVFHSVAHFGFVNWDDPTHVCDNPYLNPVTVPHVLHFWQKPYHNLFIPLSYTGYALLALLAHLRAPLIGPRGTPVPYNPHVFHLACLTLHLLNVLLVFLLLRRVVHQPWAALGGALLFGVHPVQVESVAWVSELRGLLSASLSLLALWQYLGFALLSPAPDNALRRRGLYAGALLCFVLALLAKPSAVVTPLIALLLDVGVARRDARSILRSLLGWGIVAGWCVLSTRTAQPVPPVLDLPLWQRPFIAGDALAFDLAQTLLPLRLGIDYGRSPLFVLHHAWGYASWLVPMGAGLLLWRGRRRFPVPCLAAAVFVAALLPVLGFVPFIFQDYSTVADRYLYLALLGPALALAWALARARGRTAPALCAVVLLLLACRSVVQAATWRDSGTLFRHAVALYPGSAAMRTLLGLALQDAGRGDEALPEFQAAARLRPDFTPAHLDLAIALASRGRTGDAIGEYRIVLQQTPRDFAAQLGLGQALLRQGDMTEAVPVLQTAVRLAPNDVLVHKCLALALVRTGHPAAAVDQWRQAARLRPDDTDTHYNLTVALTQLGDRAGSRAEWQTVLRLSPRLRPGQPPLPSP